MELDEIKSLIEKDGGRFVIVENGKPLLVAMGFEDYKKILEKSEQKNSGNPKASQNNGNLPKELEQEPLKIEDLPI